jgi:hypothetical protein
VSSRDSQTFDGYWRGIFQRESPRSQEPGWQNEALNVQFRGGACQGRPGLRPLHGIDFAGNITGLHWHVNADGTRQLLAANDIGTFERCSFGGDPIALTFDGLPLVDQTRVAQQKVWFLSLSGGLNHTFIYDGVNQNLKWDGTNLSKMGLPDAPTPPIGAVTPHAITDPPTGLSKGLYRYIMTLNTVSHEGDTSVVEREVLISGGGVNSVEFASPSPVPDAVGNVASISLAASNNEYDDPQVTAWRLYRTLADLADYYFVAEADIGTSIIDNLTDTELIATDKAEQFANSYPEAPIIAMAEHRGQLVAVLANNPSVLRFSNWDPSYMVPEGWPKHQAIPVAIGDGDLLTALASFNEWLVVFKSNATYAVVGDSFSAYKLVPVLASGTRQGIGTNFPGSVLHIENSVHFASRDGIYRIERGGNLSAVRISSAIDDLYSAVNFSLGSATFFDRKKRLFWWGSHG